MKWIKVENYEAMSQLGSKKIYQVIAEKTAQGKQVNIGLATGNTMIRLYELLAERLNMRRRTGEQFLSLIRSAIESI